MKHLFILFSLSLFACSCKKNATIILDTPCQEGGVSLGSLESQYGCVNTRYGMSLTAASSFLVIRSQQEFEASVTGNCLPSIDFNQYTLVIGKKQLINDNTGIEYYATKDCETKKVNLVVYITNSLGLSAPLVTWHTLLPKLAADETVEVTIELH
jgi:hypothetical protein